LERVCVSNPAYRIVSVERSRGETGFAQALARFLRKMAEHRGQGVRVVGIFSEGVIVRNRFRLGVDDKFVGIAAARFAIQRRTPLAENLFEFLLRNSGDLFDSFDAEGAKRALRDFADAGNFSHRQLCEKSLFGCLQGPRRGRAAWLDPTQLRNEPRRSEAAGAGKSGGASDRSKQLVGQPRAAVRASLGAGEIEIGFVDRDHFDDGRRISRECPRRGRSTPNIFRGGHPKKSRAGTAAPPFEAASRSESQNFQRFVAQRRRRRRADPADRRQPRACREAPAVPAIPPKRKTRPYPRGESKTPLRRTARRAAHAWPGIARSQAGP